MKRLAAALTIFLASGTWSQDARYCGLPERGANGEILRSSKLLRDFQAMHPCPATGLTTGNCPGWQMDHVIPLVCGGCDSIENLQWLPVEIKTCAGTLCKDRFERRVYCRFQGPQR